MKKKVLCMLLALCLFASFTLTSYAMLGPIDADDEAELVKPTLEITTVPENADAVARDMINHTTYYYSLSADVTDLNPNATAFRQSGFVPDFVVQAGDVISPNGIIGNIDDRELVLSTEQYPHRAIGILICRYADVFVDGEWQTPYSYGTATMFGSDVALTAAHCILDPQLGWPIEITVYPGMYGTSALPMLPYGINSVGEVTEAIISVPYYMSPESNSGYNHDWALLRLSETIGDYSGFLGFEYKLESAETTENDIWPIICGYPIDLNDPDKDNQPEYYNQYFASEKIYWDYSGLTLAENGVRYQYRKYKHWIDTTKGQSGAAIIEIDLFSNTPYTIIGIHNLSIRPDDYDEGGIEVAVRNEAVGINSHLYSIMVAYKNE